MVKKNKPDDRNIDSLKIILKNLKKNKDVEPLEIRSNIINTSYQSLIDNYGEIPSEMQDIVAEIGYYIGEAEADLISKEIKAKVQSKMNNLDTERQSNIRKFNKMIKIREQGGKIQNRDLKEQKRKIDNTTSLYYNLDKGSDKIGSILVQGETEIQKVKRQKRIIEDKAKQAEEKAQIMTEQMEAKTDLFEKQKILDQVELQVEKLESLGDDDFDISGPIKVDSLNMDFDSDEDNEFSSIPEESLNSFEKKNDDEDYISS